MKKIYWIIMALAFVATIPALTGCKTPEPTTSGNQAVQYTCPMHPEVVRNSPGNCPICGMALVKKQ